jgi:hypothetical protein
VKDRLVIRFGFLSFVRVLLDSYVLQCAMMSHMQVLSVSYVYDDNSQFRLSFTDHYRRYMTNIVDAIRI